MKHVDKHDITEHHVSTAWIMIGKILSISGQRFQHIHHALKELSQGCHKLRISEMFGQYLHIEM